MKVRSPLFVLCLIPVVLSACGRLDNATPENAANCMLAAMIRADSKTINALNKSEPTGWPTSGILEEAQRWKVVGSDISDYRLRKADNNVYEFVNEKRGVMVNMKLVLVDGRYFVVRCFADRGSFADHVRDAQNGADGGEGDVRKHLIAIGSGIFYGYAKANHVFPPAYSTNQDGKPLLSWRVLILPYIGNDDLYREFHLDEPWDSVHNKTLLSKMPDVYKAPGSGCGAVEDQLPNCAGRGYRLLRESARDPRLRALRS